MRQLRAKVKEPSVSRLNKSKFTVSETRIKKAKSPII
jgi:hypothetical protein